MPYLLFDENGSLNYIQLEQGFLLTLGCTPDCNIILPDSSRSHFRIFADDTGAWFVENLARTSSENPKITALGNGDQITLSDMTITYLDSIEGSGAQPFSGTITLSAGQKIRGYTVSTLLNRGSANRVYLVKDQKMTLDGAAARMRNDRGGVDRKAEVVERLRGIRETLLDISKSLG